MGMVLTRFLGSKATRSLTVLSVAIEAKHALERGHRLRGVFLLGVAALAWKWALLAMIVQAGLRLVRGRGSGSPAS